MIINLMEVINNFSKPKWFILMHRNKRDHSEKEEHCEVSCFPLYCCIKKGLLIMKSQSHKLSRMRLISKKAS